MLCIKILCNPNIDVIQKINGVRIYSMHKIRLITQIPKDYYTKRFKASTFLQVNCIISKQNDRNQCWALGYIIVRQPTLSKNTHPFKFLWTHTFRRMGHVYIIYFKYFLLTQNYVIYKHTTTYLASCSTTNTRFWIANTSKSTTIKWKRKDDF